MGFLNRTITKIFKNPTLGHPSPTKELPKEPLKENLQDNIEHIKTALGNSTDLVVRDFFIGSKHQMKAAIFYTDGLADSKAIQDFILESLVLEIPDLSLEPEKDNYSLLKITCLP